MFLLFFLLFLLTMILLLLLQKTLMSLRLPRLPFQFLRYHVHHLPLFLLLPDLSKKMKEQTYSITKWPLHSLLPLKVCFRAFWQHVRISVLSEEVSLSKHCSNDNCSFSNVAISNLARICRECHSPLVKTTKQIAKQTSLQQLQAIVGSCSPPTRNSKQVVHETEYVIESSKLSQSLIVRRTNHVVDNTHIFIADRLEFFDPIAVNPNSLESIKKILDKVKTIAKIGEGENERKWLFIKCDGIPYRILRSFLHQQDGKDYAWVLLLPGELHIEMNMLKAFVQFNWSVAISQFAVQMGWCVARDNKHILKAVATTTSPGNFSAKSSFLL
eukprot:Pompholyxophrys_punicea_v1_NODE_536_length_1733_cov_3.898689.p1 type:complete len:328 gc:universal NODE_536_length_1733_cov_3.898689:562-1545(+)